MVILCACSLLSAEFGAVLEGFLFSTYAGVYKSMLFWPHPFMLSACSVLSTCFVVAKCHKRPRLITSFYGIFRKISVFVILHCTDIHT